MKRLQAVFGLVRPCSTLCTEGDFDWKTCKTPAPLLHIAAGFCDMTFQLA